MFTGIIEELGKIRLITTNKIQIECTQILDDINTGDSIAVNGVCLTAAETGNKFFTADVSQETMKVTNLHSLKIGDYVNLERAMKADGRFGGHIVSGHIDNVAQLKKIDKLGEFYNLEFELPSDCARYVIKKGSVTIDGISLTIAEVFENKVTIAVIPHTFKNTNLYTLNIGSYVNIEVDILAKYIEKFLSSSDNKSRIDEKFLIECGFN